LAPEVIDDLLGVNGYKNVMTDLGTLASIHRAHAAEIAERTTVKPAELAEAEALATKLGKTVGVRELSPQVIAQATRNRQAAFTLFMKAYEEVRAAVQYVRHHEGDAGSIIPSLFAGRGGRKKAVDKGDDKPQTPVPVPPVTNPTNSPTTNPTQPAKVADISEHGPFMHG
jgi:hypothetical protein